MMKKHSWVSIWGVTGVILILGQAVAKLLPIAIEPFERMDLSPTQWIFALFWFVFMGYSEGYRGFQKAFCPRVVRRAWTLHHRSPFHHILLAPLYSMGYFHATKKRKIVSWSVTTCIFLLVISIKHLSPTGKSLMEVSFWGCLMA